MRNGKWEKGKGKWGMVKDFTDLRVWRKAKDLTVQIYKLTKNFPKEEKYGLTDQMKRASNSICANIAEGFSRFHAKDKIRFYYNARGSISECKSHIFIAKDLEYLKTEIACELLQEFEGVKMVLNGMITSLQHCHHSRTRIP